MVNSSSTSWGEKLIDAQDYLFEGQKKFFPAIPCALAALVLSVTQVVLGILTFLVGVIVDPLFCCCGEGDRLPWMLLGGFHIVTGLAVTALYSVNICSLGTLCYFLFRESPSQSRT